MKQTTAKSLTIRNVPADVRDELSSRAAMTGRSLQEYIRGELIELARRPGADALLARIRARKQATDARLPRDLILHHCDEERR